MKNQLLLILIFFGIVSVRTVRAQTYKHKLANRSGNTVEFVLSRSSISIQGYDGNQVIIKNTNYQAPPKRADGLHAIGGNGSDNTGIGLSVHMENNTLKAVQMNARGGDFKVKVPNNIHIKIQRSRLPGSDIHISDHKGEIEVKTLIGNINLKNVTGPVVVHSVSGNINVVFSELSDAAPSSISSVSGNIDITMPPETGADLKLSTISGDMYTNFDIATKGKGKHLSQIGGRDINGTLNGGGVKLKLKTISGDIFLRKKK